MSICLFFIAHRRLKKKQPSYMGLLGPVDANCLVLFYYTFCSTCFGCNTHPSSGATYNVHADDTGKCTCELQARHGVEQINSHVHLPISSACTLYVVPEDGCVLHLKHVEQKV